MPCLEATAFFIIILYLYNELESYRERRLRLALASLLESAELLKPGPAMRKMKRKMPYTCSPRKKALRKRGQPRGRCEVDADEIFDRTGVFEDAFLEYYERLLPLISQPRHRPEIARHSTTSLDAMTRLQLVLEYIRHNSTYKSLARQYSISVSQVSREVRFLLPTILASLDELPQTVPDNLVPHEFEGVVGAIDCTCHYRWRVHPCQGNWYRGDKHAFFISGKWKIIILTLIYLAGTCSPACCLSLGADLEHSAWPGPQQ